MTLRWLELGEHLPEVTSVFRVDLAGSREGCHSPSTETQDISVSFHGGGILHRMAGYLHVKGEPIA